MKQIIKLYIVAMYILNLVCIAHASDSLVVDVSKLAGKIEKKVAQHLGQPKSCKQSKYGKTCQYEKGETEIVFIDGKADWITVNNIGDIPFSEIALEAIGIKTNKPPTFYKNGAMRWDNYTIKGFEEVLIVKGDESSVWYYYIKVKTK